MPAKPTAQELRRAHDRLRALARQPGEQAAFALELLPGTRDVNLLTSVLAVLKQGPQVAAHDHLVELYRYLDDSPDRRDRGGYLRVGVVDALRHIATSSDSELFERAVMTYEKSVQEVGAPALLRAAAIVALNQVNEDLAAYHAVRLISEVDSTSPMTGEPARSAAMVLGAMGQGLLLYSIALSSAGGHDFLRPRLHPEVLAEAVRAQVDLPSQLLGSLPQTGEGVGLAWIDLLVTHADAEACARHMATLLRASRDDDEYRYAATSAIASRRMPLVQAVIDAANTETRGSRLAILVDVLPLAEGQVDTREMVRALRERVGSGPAED